MAFEPIAFKPGSADLDADDRAFADDLAELLSKHPMLSVDVCGRATAADLEVMILGATKPEQAVAAPNRQTAPAAPASATARKTAEPGPALDQVRSDLTRLAVERTRAVRRYLINDKAIAAKRVAECRPSFEPEDEGPPRVDVSL